MAFRLTHRDHASEPAPGSAQETAVRNGSAAMTGVFIMQDGFPVSGRVADSLGRPIAGATVILGLPGYSASPESIRTETDRTAASDWSTPHTGGKSLIVEADGFAPVLREMAVKPGPGAGGGAARLVHRVPRLAPRA